MAIDLAKALGAELPPVDADWDEDQVLLYHLGVGAGLRDACDPRELRYVYERDLQVLPTFGVIPVFESLFAIAGLPGLEVDPLSALHGEQHLRLHRPLRTSGSVTTTARIVEIWDKGKGASVVLDAESVDRVTGEPWFTNRFVVFFRGEGGFGGESGPKSATRALDRPADHVVEAPTLPGQALLYRLSGDRNPLHIDPDLAVFGGFDRPILHGLCTYGITCKAVVDTCLGGDAAAVAGFGGRFTGSVLPGETLAISMWDEGSEVVVSVTTVERGDPVLGNATLQRSGA